MDDKKKMEKPMEEEEEEKGKKGGQSTGEGKGWESDDKESEMEE